MKGLMSDKALSVEDTGKELFPCMETKNKHVK